MTVAFTSGLSRMLNPDFAATYWFGCAAAANDVKNNPSNKISLMRPNDLGNKTMGPASETVSSSTQKNPRLFHWDSNGQDRTVYPSDPACGMSPGPCPK